MPSYTHLVDFLKTPTNGDRTSSTPTEIKKAPDQHNRQRQHAPRIHTFATTHKTLACPTCQGPHEIWHCDVFKVKSAKNLLEIVKKASLCTNFLGTEHTHAQYSAGSCRICRQRHHTYLHQHQGHDKSRSSSGQSSSGHSSSDRSSNGRSSPSSSTPPSSHRSRRASTSPLSSPLSSTRTSPRGSPRTSPKREPRCSRTKVVELNLPSSSQRHGKE
jgi:hypothetical protein